jgi:hypothetical protein
MISGFFKPVIAQGLPQKNKPSGLSIMAANRLRGLEGVLGAMVTRMTTIRK